MPNELFALLAAQDGVITRLQALCFVSESALRNLLKTRWRILLPGVYLATKAEPTLRQRLRAAVLYGGDTAQLSDAIALAAYGVRYLPDNDPVIRLLLPATVKRANRDGVVARRTHRLPEPNWIEGLPYSPPARALVDFAMRTGNRRNAVAVLADAVQRKIAAVSGLVAELPHISGRGEGVARDVIEMIVAGVRSAPEADFLMICRSSRVMPEPMLNPLVLLPCGRKVSPDALIVASALVHESNGRENHADEDPFESMQARHDAMTTGGLAVLHNSGRQLRTEALRIRTQAETTCRDRHGMGLPPGVIILRAGPPMT
jgi:hypothetical protein